MATSHHAGRWTLVLVAALFDVALAVWTIASPSNVLVSPILANMRNIGVSSAW